MQLITLYSKSPKARETLKNPPTLFPITFPPASLILSFSDAVFFSLK